MIRRTELAGAVDDRLFFAQVREDPMLELSAMEGCWDGPVVVITSGGCTALSMVAMGATDVVAVDLNRTQNHVAELKAVAVADLGVEAALGFLGGAESDRGLRLRQYHRIRGGLSAGAKAYWDEDRGAVGKGVLGAGASERLSLVIRSALRWVVEGRGRIERLLACRTVEEQRELYHREWDNRRWRAMFAALCNRLVFRKTYDPAFFANVEDPSFVRHFHDLAEHTLTDLPVADNYFLHHLVRGVYPAEVPGGVPPYLDAKRADTLAAVRNHFALVDGTLLDHLRSCPDGSVAGYSISNICEWLSEDDIDALFTEIVRTARPGAVLCFRNFVGWTEVPQRWRHAVVEDRARGEALIRTDRSLCQRRIAVCAIPKED